MLFSAALRTMRILWIALLGSIGIYVALAYSGLLKVPPQTPEPIVLAVFGFLSVAAAVMSFVLPAMTYRQAVAKMELATVEEVEPQVFAAGYRDATPKTRRFASPSEAAKRAAMVFQTPFILSLAFSEAVAVCGFMAVMMGFDKLLAAPFFAVGALLMLLRFPTADQIRKPFESALGATFPPEPQ